MTLQVVEPEHAIVLAVPTWILHIALVSHTTFEFAPSFRSQFELAVHVTWLPSPAAALHCDESLHVIRIASFELPSHFAELLHASEHVPSHVVLQSSPVVQVHAVSAHVQPVPVQTGALPPSLPHAAVAIRNVKTMMFRIQASQR